MTVRAYYRQLCWASEMGKGQSPRSGPFNWEKRGVKLRTVLELNAHQTL